MNRLIPVVLAASIALLAVVPVASAAQNCHPVPTLPPGGNIPDTYNAVRDAAVEQCDVVLNGLNDAYESVRDAAIGICNDQLGDTLCPL